MTTISFNSSSSWVVISNIERRIKEKIIEHGQPLSLWNLSINYGIKTGLNEAFVISEKTKDKLISEDPKSAEIIRPILRGRDIKRYSYSFNDLYLICTFPSLHIRIDDYPSIKQHLLSFGIERLEQTGKEHVLNGTKIKSRKKTQNQWFETQDSIAYWDEFSKPKIIYPDISANFAFAYDQSKMLINNTAYMITCDEEAKLKALFVILHSKLIAWYYGLISVQLGSQAVRMFSQYVEELPIVRAGEDGKISELFERLINEKDKALVQRALDDYVNSLYCLNKEESDFILSH